MAVTEERVREMVLEVLNQKAAELEKAEARASTYNFEMQTKVEALDELMARVTAAEVKQGAAGAAAVQTVER